MSYSNLARSVLTKTPLKKKKSKWKLMREEIEKHCTERKLYWDMNAFMADRYSYALDVLATKSEDLDSVNRRFGEKEKTHKKSLKVAVIGHTSSGKSTTAGLLPRKYGGIDKGTTEDMDKEDQETCFRWVTALFRRPSGLALDLDKLRAEHERESHVFETSKYEITIIDAPERGDYLKNGIYSAHGDYPHCVALLVVSVDEKSLESGPSKISQIRDQATLAFSLGVNKRVIVACNKMDATDPPYSEPHFNKAVRKVGKCLMKIGYDTAAIPFVPISSLCGDNILEESHRMPWYQGWSVQAKNRKAKGVTLLEALDRGILSPRPSEKPLRVCVQDIYKVTGIGTVVLGRVEAGILEPGMTITFAPQNLTAKVKSIVVEGYLQRALPGDNVAFNVEGVGEKEIHRGDVVGNRDDDPPKRITSFTAKVSILKHPARIVVGCTPVLHCHTARVACKFAKLMEKCDWDSGKPWRMLRRCTSSYRVDQALKFGDSAIVQLIPMKPLRVESFNDYPSMGRFFMRHMRQTVAIGTIKSVSTEEAKESTQGID